MQLPKISEELSTFPTTARKCEFGWDMSRIKEGLFVGTRKDAINLANSRQGDKLRILTVDIESLEIALKDGVLTKHVPCVDEPEADLLSFFDDCSEFISSGLENEEIVLVHW